MSSNNEQNNINKNQLPPEYDIDTNNIPPEPPIDAYNDVSEEPSMDGYQIPPVNQSSNHQIKKHQHLTRDEKKDKKSDFINNLNQDLNNERIANQNVDNAIENEMLDDNNDADNINEDINNTDNALQYQNDTYQHSRYNRNRKNNRYNKQVQYEPDYKYQNHHNKNKKPIDNNNQSTNNTNQYLMVIDPILLLNEKELKQVKDSSKTTGELGDAIQNRLSQRYPFVHVAQSSNETHDVKVHDFLLQDKTNKSGMQDMGKIKTPSDLIAYASVDANWIKQHPKQAKAGSFVKMDSKIDPKQLHANEGITRNGKSAGFLRYGRNQYPLMVMVPKNHHDYDHENINDMEQRAQEENNHRRDRPSKGATMYNMFKMASQAGAIGAFMAGWKLIDKFDELNQQDELMKQESKQISNQQQKDNENKPKFAKFNLSSGLNDLSDKTKKEKEATENNPLVLNKMSHKK